MHTANATLTVNAAFMQEIKEVNQELWSTLEEAETICDDQATNPGRIVAIFAELRDQVALHFALEEAYGYFEGPVTVAPRLSQKAERLRSEHRSLYGEINALAEDVEDWHYRRQLPQFSRTADLRLKAFHSQLREHEQLETELLLQAYDDDIGVGD